MAGDLELLKKSGITHVLNVASEKIEYFPKDFIYHHVSVLDVPEENLIAKLDECIAFIKGVKNTGKLLVHCMAGISRSESTF